jgi:hypothetical protein
VKVGLLMKKEDIHLTNGSGSGSGRSKNMRIRISSTVDSIEKFQIGINIPNYQCLAVNVGLLMKQEDRRDV